MLIVTLEVIPEGQDFSLQSFTILVKGVTCRKRIEGYSRFRFSN